MRKVSILIPMYNEEETIEKIVRKIVNVSIPYEKEIIIVDDGSQDSSLQKARNLAKKENSIKVFSKKNEGKGSAVKYAIKKASGDILIIQDADLEYEPGDYKKLLKEFSRRKAKVVYGSRIRNFKKNKKFSHFSFFIGGIGVTIFTNILYFRFLTDVTTCYKVFSKDLKPLLVNSKGNGFDWEPEITCKILRKRYKIYEVPINYYPRSKSQGKKIKWSDGVKWLYIATLWRFKRVK